MAAGRIPLIRRVSARLQRTFQTATKQLVEREVGYAILRRLETADEVVFAQATDLYLPAFALSRDSASWFRQHCPPLCRYHDARGNCPVQGKPTCRPSITSTRTSVPGEGSYFGHGERWD